MKKVAIVSAVRTAVGNFLGSLSEFSAPKLGSIVIKEVLKKINLKEELVDEVIMGNILQAGLGQNPARQSAILAGIPYTVPSHTVNKVCGSGLKAVILAAQSIMLGDADIIVAGGTENMSAAPYLLDKARIGYRLGHAKIIDSMIQDGLWCSLTNIHMGLTAENLAQKYTLSREAQDKFALESQKKAAQAQKNGKFKEEIVEIKILQKKGDSIIFSADEFVKLDTSLEKLAKLKPAFKDNGTVTAGNASGINDGAAAVILMSEEKAKEFNLIPLAYIKGYAYSGVAPDIMGIGPVEAVKKVLNKTNLKIEDLELIEANEAFAAQSLTVLKELNLNPEKVNVNGGAIALGHPIGASGTRILVTLLYEMKRRNLHLGLATLCIGGGQGISLIVERG